MFILRPYQTETVDKSLEYFYQSKKQKPTLTVAPVAAGKSLIIGSVTSQLKTPTIVLQPSMELLEQNYEKLISFGGSASIYSASFGIKEISETTYATLGSIKNIAEEFVNIGVENVIIDEAHFGYSPKKGSMFMNFMNTLKPKYVMGFTATPIRLKNYGGMEDNYSQLNIMTRTRPKFFNSINHVVPIKTMVDNDYWSKLIYQLYDFDESKLLLNSTGAEYTEKSISKAVNDQDINNKIYIHISKLLKLGRKNILVFMDSVENAQRMSDTLGDISYCVDGKMSKKLRREVVESFKNGHIKVVTNWGTLTTGFDHPLLDTIILGRPTNSLALLYQMIGRGTRIHPDKKDCLIIDYCNNIKRLGQLENLNIQNIEGYGWGMFNRDVLLTGTPMGYPSKTKDDLSKKETISSKDKGDIIMWFGKFKGKPLSKIPYRYMEFIKKEFDFKTPKLKELEKQIDKHLEKR